VFNYKSNICTDGSKKKTAPIPLGRSSEFLMNRNTTSYTFRFNNFFSFLPLLSLSLSFVRYNQSSSKKNSFDKIY